MSKKMSVPRFRPGCDSIKTNNYICALGRNLETTWRSRLGTVFLSSFFF